MTLVIIFILALIAGYRLNPLIRRFFNVHNQRWIRKAIEELQLPNLSSSAIPLIIKSYRGIADDQNSGAANFKCCMSVEATIVGITGIVTGYRPGRSYNFQQIDYIDVRIKYITEDLSIYWLDVVITNVPAFDHEEGWMEYGAVSLFKQPGKMQ